MQEGEQRPPAEALPPLPEGAPPTEEVQAAGSRMHDGAWDASCAMDPSPSAQRKSSSGPTIEVRTITAAADGGEHIQIVWTDKWVPGGRSVWFEIATLDGHGVEANPRQRNFNKTYRGVGSMKTDVLPLGRIGWRGKMLVLDTDSGETKEVRWRWIPLYPGILYRIRRFFVGD
jgi:hypothetical protein